MNHSSITPNYSIENKLGGVILGIDEAGRGSVAGPVVAAGIILNRNIDVSSINDSKKLSPKKRELIYNYLIKNCNYVVSSSSVDEIEVINILEASMLAMRRVINNIKSTYNYIIVDGNVNPNPSINNLKTIIDGDKISLSIAAASIIAKVTRDSIMNELDKYSPQYLWYRNKGYGTKHHINAIKKYGVTSHHRRSFLKKYLDK